MRSIPFTAQSEIQAAGWGWFRNEMHSKRIGNMDFYRFKDRLSTFSQLKTSKIVYEVLFFDMQKYIYSENGFNTIYIHIIHKC